MSLPKEVEEGILKSAAVKYDQGKPAFALLSPIALEEIAKVMGYGATKYADHNWRAGFKWSRVASAALRHFFAWLGGEDMDSESGHAHLAHCACCILFLLEFAKTHPELDDRYKV